MVDAHCVRDEGGFTVHWLVVAFDLINVRVKVRVQIIYCKQHVNHVVEKR